MTKSPNKYTTWNIGKKCQNCNKVGWRMSDKFSTSELAVFYCVYCGMFFGKINDFPLGKLRKQFLKKLKGGINKNGTRKSN